MMLYAINDMVKIGCHDCQGCFACCQGMGQSIVLDPYDIWQFETHLDISFAMLMQNMIELHVEDGLILPNLKMQENLQRCGFLNGEGRCGIHDFRPGLCRLFPLGRNYEDGSLRYFLLEDACPNSGQMKMKIKKWLDIPDGRSYEKFLISWHDLRKKLQGRIAELQLREDNGTKQPESDSSAMPETVSDTAVDTMEYMKRLNMLLLQIFYEKQYMPEDFFPQFEERLSIFENAMPETI